jgi:hypothetical protein
MSEVKEVQKTGITELSNDLNVITAEINSYKQIAGQAIFEIGRRLKHVRDNDLAHGQWTNWVEEKCGFTVRTAQRFIKIVEELGGKATTWSHLGWRALYEIATMPEEDREKTHTIPSTGEQKTVDEMSVRELHEVKKALKEKEEALKEAQERADAAIKEKAELVMKLDFQRDVTKELEREIEILKKKQSQSQPQVIEKVVEKRVEVIPKDVKQRMEELEVQLRKLEEQNLQKEFEYQRLREEYEQLVGSIPQASELAARTTEFVELVRDFMERASIYSYLSRQVSDMSDFCYSGYNAAISQLEDFVRDMRANIEKASAGIIEAEIIVRPTTNLLTNKEEEKAV